MHLGEIPNTKNERMIYFSDGGWAKLVREDPYGMWVIKWHAGATPFALQSQFTEIDLARQAVTRFVNSNEYNGYAKIVPEKVEMAPPLEVKKRYRKEEAQA